MPSIHFRHIELLALWRAALKRAIINSTGISIHAYREILFHARPEMLSNIFQRIAAREMRSGDTGSRLIESIRVLLNEDLRQRIESTGVFF